MAYSRTLPLVAGLSILGAAGGVWLGRSAIAEIDPAYFAAAPDRFHADQVPYRSPDWAQVQVAEFQQTGTIEGLGTGCMGCAGQGDVVYAAPAIATYSDGWTAAAAQQAGPVAAAEAPAPDPDMERVVLYASYAVSSEEAERRAAAEVAEAAPEAYASVELGSD